MLSKKEKKGLCPLNKFKECNDNCVLYRRGTRYNEVQQEVMPVELCAFNVIADNIEAMHSRTFCIQQEMGELKTVTAFSVLTGLGLKTKEETQRAAERILIKAEDKVEEKKSLPEK